MTSLINCTTKLGFGMMRLPRLPDGSIDLAQSTQMVDAFLAAGGKYFDTAFVYPGSEEATRHVLCDRYPRESYYLASKLNAGKSFCKNREAALAQFKTTLQRTGAGYLDFYLMHGMDEDNVALYEEYGIWDYMKQLKAEGLVKHIGFSFHDTPETLEMLLNKYPEAEFVQLQINYIDWEDKIIQARACYEVAEKHHKPVVVMEPVKGGLLANPPQKVTDVLKAADPQASAASWAVRFAASLPNVMVVLSGMSTPEQVADNTGFMKQFVPLSAAEQQTVARAREEFAKVDRIACTACHYCTPGCPMQIHIPDIFASMNIYKMYGNLAMAKHDYNWRPGGPRASACIGCGQCEAACPQHLPIIRNLREVADTLEK